VIDSPTMFFVAIIVTTDSYSLMVADRAQVPDAQRLRYSALREEFGDGFPASADGIDRDEFDEYCDHLIVRHDPTGMIVGTYRMMTAGCAARIGCRYSDATFDLSGLDGIRDSLVETGRACVHPEHRNGTVINLIWAGIARYLRTNDLRWLGGCAWVPLHDGGHTASAVWERVRGKYLSPAELSVRPRMSLPRPPAGDAGKTVVPALLHGYLRLGSWICGEPAYDPAFGVAAFYVLLDVDRMNPRYRRHFFDDAEPLVS
jgi:putative hemolysin